MLIKTMRPSEPIKDPYHYREFLTHVLIKKNPYYPGPTHYGRRLTRNEVIKSWERARKQIRKGLASDTLSIYVHLPFCRSHCYFCQSPNITVKDERRVLPQYLKALYQEMAAFSAALRGFEVTTVYFGGGTPSLMTPEETKEIFGRIRKYFRFSPRARFIFEASPYTLDFQKLDTLKELGIHELDLGIESFDDKVLRQNNRPQNTAQTIKIIRYAKKIGIPSISCDLMVGLPHQSPASALKTVALATLLPIDGIYICPFMPQKSTKFRLKGQTYSPEKIAERNRLKAIADKFLQSSGYQNTFFGLRKNWTPKDQEQAYAAQEVTNLLGFGHEACSRIIGSLRYTQTLKGGTAFAYRGIKMDANKEMHVYAYTHIYDLSLKEFKKRFGKDFRKVFAKELKVLTERSKLCIRKGRVVFLNEDPVTNKVIRNFFLDRDYIQKALASDKEKYDPRRDYRALIAPLAV